MSLFSDLYNTLSKFFHSQEVQEDASKSVATNRLKLVLMQDRTNLTPRILEQMRSELIDLLSRYVELDKELLDLNFEQEGDQVALMLSIPVIRAKDEEEIDAAIKQHEEMLKAALKKESEEEIEEENAEEEDVEGEILSDSGISEMTAEEETEEEKAESEKNNAIAKELNAVPKIIKKKEKKEISAPEEITNSGNNPFKTDSADVESKI
jgi:cell division topological specificity factor